MKTIVLGPPGTGKTETLLRKNSSHYLEITQRFLLNISKLMR